MGVRVYESMTRIPLVVQEPAMRRGWNARQVGCVRVWRSEASLEAACNPDRSDIYRVMEALGPEASTQEIITALDRLPRIEAIEVLDAEGCGALLYPNWE